MKSSLIVYCLGMMFSLTLNAQEMLFSTAYKYALENANGIKSSEYLSLADEELVEQEKSKLYPQVNLSGYYKKSEYEVPEYEANRQEKEVKDQSLFSYSLSIKQSLYNQNIYSQIDLQDSKSEYSSTQVAIEKEELAQSVFSIYLDMLKSKNTIELYKSYLKHNKTKLQELEKKYKLKLVNKMDLLEMKVDYNSALIDLSREEKLFAVYNLKFKKYIGEREYELPKINTQKSILEMIHIMQKSIDNSKESLKIKQARAATEISKYEIESAQAEHMPKLNLDAAYTGFDTDDPDVETPYNYRMYAMVTLDIPIYSGGYTSSKVKFSKLHYKAALEDLKDVQKDVYVEYREHLTLFESSIESVEMYIEALESAKLYKTAIEKGYTYGLKSISDLNEAESKYYEVKYKYIENIYELVSSYIGLLIVTNNFKDVVLLDKLISTKK